MHSILQSRYPVPISAASLLLPMAGSTVRAGFASPAEDLGAKPIDLTELLITHPPATFLLGVCGFSMINEGIGDGDLIIVNRAIKPRHGHIVVALIDGEFTVKKLYILAGVVMLVAGNPDFPDFIPHDGQTIEVWGVVTHCIKKFWV